MANVKFFEKVKGHGQGHIKMYNTIRKALS